MKKLGIAGAPKQRRMQRRNKGSYREEGITLHIAAKGKCHQIDEYDALQIPIQSQDRASPLLN
jgi:hypothetical protein